MELIKISYIMDTVLSAPAFVIHLPRSTERGKFFKKNIPEAGFTDMRIFEGVDGRDANARADAILQFGFPPIDLEMSYGMIGCNFSHLKVLKHIIDNDIPLATVFEDDVHFHPEWKTLSEKYWKLTPPDFDMLYIGNGLDSCRASSDPSTIQEITTEGAWCTHAYVVTRAGAEKVMNALLKWDYKEFNHGSRGKTLTGMYTIDIMLLNMYHRATLGEIEKPFIWYAWNGTRYPCAFNKLPIRGNDCRNTGLVFQNADVFASLASENNHNLSGNFYDENLNIIDISNYETTEQWIADTFISPDATVLELGGRLGVVSVRINKRLTDTRRHYVVEPDEHVFRQMFRNILHHGCNPRVLNGTISKKPLFFERAGLSSRARDEPCSCNSFIVPNKSLQQVIQETGLQFDTLVADCEGCLEGFIDENIDYLNNFKMITFEEDYSSECNYEKIKRILGDHHFVCVRPGGHSVWTRRIEAPARPRRSQFVWNRR